MQKALITGITGQDGSFLAEMLLKKGYEVHGVIRRSSSFNTDRIDHIFDKLKLHHGDMTDASCLRSIILETKPDEIYNLAAQSHVKVSFELPNYTAQVNAIGTLNILEAIKGTSIRLYQASTSELYGNSPAPQNEDTPFNPCSPYACSKLFAHSLVNNYRDAYGVHASCGILFNHGSERRGETFVTRKITRAVGRIASGLQDKLYLGNLDAKRDWGYAPDYVEAMWLMLQQDKPDDYVIATGETHTVRQFCRLAFAEVGLNYEEFVVVDPSYYRPTEVNILLGDATKAREKLGWKPRCSFMELVRAMVVHDIELADKELRLSK